MDSKTIRLIFIFTITQYLCNAQPVKPAGKIIIDDKVGYYCNVRSTDQSILLFRFGIDSSDRDSIYIFDKPSGLFEYHPIVFDVIDSTLFQIRVYTSGDGMQYSELRGYKESQIKQYYNKDNGYDYVGSNNTLLDNSLPLNSYIRRIIRSEDTLKGPLYFDLIATPDSLLLFIYIDYLQKMEIWNFVRYPLIIGKSSFDESKKIMKKKPWELSRVVATQIGSSFKLIQLNGEDKIYALTDDGNLFDLSKEYAEKVESRSPIKSMKGIIVDKKMKSTRCFSERDTLISMYNFFKMYKSSEMIGQE